MRRAIFLIASVCVLVLGYVASSCTHNANLANVPAVSFSKNVLPLFEGKCNMTGCHGADGRHRQLTSYNTVINLVKPGNANASQLYQSIIGSQSSTRMPPSGDWLTEAQTNIVFLWIMQGAMDN